MIVFSLLFILFLICFGWVTICGKDAWPFSHYPMFSRLSRISDVEVFRLALETKDNEVVWWKSGFFRYPEFVGERLGELSYARPASGGVIFITFPRNRILSEVLRLIISEEGNTDRYRAFHIVKRTACSKGRDLQIEDRIIAKIPMEEIKRIQLA